MRGGGAKVYELDTKHLFDLFRHLAARSSGREDYFS